MEIICNYIRNLADGYQMIKPYISENLDNSLGWILCGATFLGWFLAAGFVADERYFRRKEISDLVRKLEENSDK